MVGLDKQFIEATDSLIALYRGIERRTLDLPSVSVMPFFIFFWSVLKFYFYFLVGIVLITPVNFLIFVRNLLPGKWQYRPFFLHHVYYVWV